MSEQEKIQTADDRPQMANPIPEDDGMAEGHGIAYPRPAASWGTRRNSSIPPTLPTIWRT